MLDYKKMYETMEKKLSEVWNLPYSEKNIEMIERYLKMLNDINCLMEEGSYSKEAEAVPMSHYTREMDNKSEFEQIVWGIIKTNDKAKINMLIKELDAIAMMFNQLHPTRYNQFLSKLKEIK